MKRIMAILLCVVSVFMLASCGQKSETQTSSNPSKVSEASENTSSEAKIVAGSNQNNAPIIPLGEKISGTVKGGEYAWFAFTTGSTKGDPYAITFVNTSKDADDLYGYLYDEYGEQLDYKRATNSGTPSTMNTDQLEADTTYYICLNPRIKETVDYTLVVKNLNGPSSGEDQTVSGGQLSGEEVIPGSSQNDAVLVPLGTKVFGKVESNMHAWFSFTTGETSGATYNITVVNASQGADDLYAYLCDEYGTELGYKRVTSSGAPVTISTNQLETNTTYYVRLHPRLAQTLDYSVIVKDPDSKNTAYQTAGIFSEAKGSEESEDGEVTAGSNVNNAPLIPTGIKVYGSVEGGEYAWFGFKTGDKSDTTYTITTVNDTPGADDLYIYIYDEYGEQIGYKRALSEGTPVTISETGLKKNTIYYVCVTPRLKETMDYSLLIKSSEKKSKPKEPLVFEVPFEINETQVQFVINQAIFIDEEKAKEVLKPVAEEILKHPDHSVLIAGTTATDGTQETCVDLSTRRAEAVKKLLMETYHVPESQLKIIGLGYERDPFERGKDRDSNGNFVESEGRKNRRVVILDIDDPIAKKLLNEK